MSASVPALIVLNRLTAGAVRSTADSRDVNSQLVQECDVLLDGVFDQAEDVGERLVPRLGGVHILDALATLDRQGLDQVVKGALRRGVVHEGSPSSVGGTSEGTAAAGPARPAAPAGGAA